MERNLALWASVMSSVGTRVMMVTLVWGVSPGCFSSSSSEDDALRSSRKSSSEPEPSLGGPPAGSTLSLTMPTVLLAVRMTRPAGATSMEVLEAAGFIGLWGVGLGVSWSVTGSGFGSGRGGHRLCRPEQGQEDGVG